MKITFALVLTVAAAFVFSESHASPCGKKVMLKLACTVRYQLGWTDSQSCIYNYS